MIELERFDELLGKYIESFIDMDHFHELTPLTRAYSLLQLAISSKNHLIAQLAVKNCVRVIDNIITLSNTKGAHGVHSGHSKVARELTRFFYDNAEFFDLKWYHKERLEHYRKTGKLFQDE